MRKTLLIPATMMLAISLSGPAQAQLARTYVAAGGIDAGTCDRPAPCATFQFAHNVTASGGEITVLSPGGYGAVMINRAISINNDGVGEVGMLVSGGATGVTVNAGAGDVVNLRGLTIRGIGSGGGNGIVFNSGKSLSVENCVIRNLSNELGGRGIGLMFQPNAASNLAVSNTLIADNANSGVVVQPVGNGAVTAVLTRVETYNNGIYGFYASSLFASGGSLRATVDNSVAAGNSEFGFMAVGNGRPTALMLTRSVAASNAGGVAAAFSTATLRMSQSVLTGNGRSWATSSGAVLRSYGDNNIDGNADGDPVPPTTLLR